MMLEKLKIEKKDIEAQPQKERPQKEIEDFAGRISQSLEKEQEKKELPPLNIDIFYSSHGTAEDIKELAERLKEADVYIPEFFNWDRKDLKIFRDISGGRLWPEEALKKLGKVSFPDFIHKLFDIIYNSNKPITFIDLPSGDSLAEQVQNYAFLKIDFEFSFEKIQEYIRSFLKGSSEAQNKREEYMIANLKPKIKELLKIYPKLQNKKKLNVLLSMGSVHSPLYFELKKEAAKAKRKFNKVPHVFGFYDEGLRREKLGKKLTDELITQILLEKIFSDALRPFLKTITKDSERIQYFLRLIASKFQIDEIEMIYQEVKKAKNGRELFGMFDRWFKSENIQFPRSEEEMDKLLGIKNKKVD